LQVRNYPPAEARWIREKGIEAFRTFCDCVQEPATEAVGGYLNKSAIVYADAVLQAALDGLYEPVAEYLKETKNLNISSELKVDSVGGKLNKLREAAKNMQGLNLPKSGHARLVAELRHKITHNAGCVDGKFLVCCGVGKDRVKKLIRQTPKGGWTCEDGPYWGPEYPWKNEEDFLIKNWCEQVRGGTSKPQVDLAIDTVVIPCLRGCVEFIEDLKNALAALVT
jgi:hypothetical protein